MNTPETVSLIGSAASIVVAIGGFTMTMMNNNRGIDLVNKRIDDLRLEIKGELKEVKDDIKEMKKDIRELRERRLV
jgi:hypothetical protein